MACAASPALRMSGKSNEIGRSFLGGTKRSKQSLSARRVAREPQLDRLPRQRLRLALQQQVGRDRRPIAHAFGLAGRIARLAFTKGRPRCFAAAISALILSPLTHYQTTYVGRIVGNLRHLNSVSLLYHDVKQSMRRRLAPTCRTEPSRSSAPRWRSSPSPPRRRSPTPLANPAAIRSGRLARLMANENGDLRHCAAEFLRDYCACFDRI